MLLRRPQVAQMQAATETELGCARSALDEAQEAVEDMKSIMADTACILDQKNAEVRRITCLLRNVYYQD